MARPLGRRAPTDWRHYEKFPLTAATTPAAPTPVAIGVNWYSDFDNPVKKGSRHWIGLNPKQLGSVRGGHCVCLEPATSSMPRAPSPGSCRTARAGGTSTTRARRAPASALGARG